MCGSGSANYGLFGSELYAQDEGNITMEMIYQNLSNDAYMQKIDANTYLLHYRLRIAGDVVLTTLNIEDCTVRLNSSMSIGGGTHALYSDPLKQTALINANNATIGVWNTTTDSWQDFEYKKYDQFPNTEHKSLSFYSDSIQNTTFYGTNRIYVRERDNGIYKNINVYNSTNGLYFQNLDGAEVSNIYSSGIVLNGHTFIGFTNGTVDNVTLNNDIANYHYDASGGDGIAFGVGRYNEISNITINYSSYSGFRFAGGHAYSNVTNVDLDGSGHVGLDIHGANHLTIDNVNINDSKTDNFIFSIDGDILSYENTVSNITSSNVGTSRSHVANADAYNNTVINLEVLGTAGYGVQYFDLSGFKLYNLSIPAGQDVDYGYVLTNFDGATDDVALIDTDQLFTNLNQIQFVTSDHTNVSFINVNASITGSNTAGYYRGYYANILVVDGNSNPIEGAILTFNATVRDANGDIQTSFVSDSSGTFSVSDRNNLPALEDSITYNVTATYNGTSNSTIITPDMLVYSPDSSNIQSDLVSIVLDVDITEYWTPTPGTHYIGVPETHSWIGGEWVVTYSGTYTEAQTEVTGVEIRP
jgi:hypothetical protein